MKERLKSIINRMLTPRQNTDVQSEILNVIAAPIYIYTITTVFYYNLFHIMPYHYGNSDQHDKHENNSDDNNEINWMLPLHRLLLAMIYFQMMSNWLAIKYVDNSLASAWRCNDGAIRTGTCSQLSAIVVDRDKNGASEKYHNNSKGDRSRGLIPGPISAPPTPERQSYWSWKICRKCNLNAPPRCHHCPMCGVCVLKRDHHCFFTATCIGFYNQRHFIVFLMWASFGTAVTTLYFIPYYFRVVLPEIKSVFEIFPPFALIRWIFGFTAFRLVNMSFAFLFNFLFVFLSTGFLVDQWSYVKSGLTQFETKSLNKRRLNIVDPRPLGDKIRAVLGLNYGLSVVFPLSHLLWKPHENPYEWPELKIYRGHL